MQYSRNAVRENRPKRDLKTFFRWRCRRSSLFAFLKKIGDCELYGTNKNLQSYWFLQRHDFNSQITSLKDTSFTWGINFLSKSGWDPIFVKWDLEEANRNLCNGLLYYTGNIVRLKRFAFCNKTTNQKGQPFVPIYSIFISVKLGWYILRQYIPDKISEFCRM